MSTGTDHPLLGRDKDALSKDALLREQLTHTCWAAWNCLFFVRPHISLGDYPTGDSQEKRDRSLQNPAPLRIAEQDLDT